MPTRKDLYHNSDVFSDHAKPVYVKQLNDKLLVSLSYVDQKPNQTTDQNIQECLISFHNISTSNLVINPTATEESTVDTERLTPATSTNGNPSWFGGFFRQSLESTVSNTTTLLNNTPTDDIKIFLGNIQLVGYLVLNYKLSVGTPGAVTIDLGGGPKTANWWNNKEYVDIYQTEIDDAFENEDEREYKLDSIPFIRQNLKKKLILGGKIGGINDLVVKNNDLFIDENNKYLVHDLLYNFNTHLPPKFNDSENKDIYKIPAKELSDPIVPFYSTSQALLFTDLTIHPSSTRTFHIKFPQNNTLPPSYNTRSTGPTCDQGWLSIKYSLVVTLSEQQQLIPKSIYFPMEVKGERIGNNERWNQHNFFQNITVDKSWKINIIESNDSKDYKNGDHKSIETREVFLEDLSKLIESDLYNMPKISTNERKKSIPTIYENDTDSGLIPQLPSHLKTQFQLRVNNYQLCLISLSRPYYHIGDDINFVLNVNPIENSRTTKVAGLVVYLEAHEVFHCREANSAREEDTEKLKDVVNAYRVTGSLKFNTLSTSLFNTIIPNGDQKSAPINGSINVPRYLSQQFQSSTLMDLKYYIVFKFNLAEFGNSSDEPPQVELEEQPEQTLEYEGDESQIPPSNGVEHERQEHLLNNGDEDISPPSIDNIFETVERYRVDTMGSELRFRLPLILLP
ncbi:Rgp1-domain-containing protein [Scheffersomyces coipomensis]|uniref:Rgp1-domain-containing protein n=1 Tax=Scheffersomyces coipomensis TaxID=1788519 RepID=UPI00315DE4A7